MPISPEMRVRYPADWPEISARVRFERAGGRCECDGICGEDHGGRCEAVNGARHPVTRSAVVLTVGHLNHTPEDNRPENLRAFCQRCHLAHDRDHHQANARRTHARRRIAALANRELFEDDQMGVAK